MMDVLRRIVAIPAVYNFVQNLAGASTLRRHLAALVKSLRPAPFILDVGGGTGMYRGVWLHPSAYVCLDIDAAKLRGFISKYPADLPLLADAAYIPLHDKSLDIVVCTAVAHHLSDKTLALFIQESARVLNDNGIFVFLDAVYQPRLRLSRWLWALDQGRYSRSVEQLQAAITEVYHLAHSERFSVYHEYWLCAGDKKRPVCPEAE
jgi:ubiquinone/menaquinone biosynthesis C-methylase UbiE